MWKRNLEDEGVFVPNSTGNQMIAGANARVSKVQSPTKKRNKSFQNSYSTERRADIGKYA